MAGAGEHFVSLRGCSFGNLILRNKCFGLLLRLGNHVIRRILRLLHHRLGIAAGFFHHRIRFQTGLARERFRLAASVFAQIIRIADGSLLRFMRLLLCILENRAPVTHNLRGLFNLRGQIFPRLCDQLLHRGNVDIPLA